MIHNYLTSNTAHGIFLGTHQSTTMPCAHPFFGGIRKMEKTNNNSQAAIVKGADDGKMNKTTCITCKKELVLPPGFNPDYFEYDPLINSEVNEKYGVYGDPWMGGYFCKKCYDKAYEEAFPPRHLEAIVFEDEKDNYDIDYTGQPVECVSDSIVDTCVFLFECNRCGHRWSSVFTPSVCTDCDGDEIWGVSFWSGCQECGGIKRAWKCPKCGSVNVVTPLWDYGHIETVEKDSEYVKEFLSGTTGRVKNGN